MVRVSVLGAAMMEAANLEASDHFAKLKKKVSPNDAVFELRERAALVFHAYEGKVGDDFQPLADSVDELVTELGYEAIGVLYGEWSRLQAEVTARPMTSKQMETLIEELKKNIQGVPLGVLPSSWLIELVRTLASQPVPSTLESGAGL